MPVRSFSGFPDAAGAHALDFGAWPSLAGDQQQGFSGLQVAATPTIVASATASAGASTSASVTLSPPALLAQGGAAGSFRQAFTAGAGANTTASVTVGVTGTAKAGANAIPEPYKTLILSETGLVAYWPLNEASGTSAADATGNGHTGTASGSGILGGATGIPADGSGKAALLAVADDITPANATSFPTGNNAWSLEAWIKPSAVAATSGIIAYGDLTTGNNGIEMAAVSATEIDATNSAGNILTATGLSSLTGGTWHHIVFTYTGTVLTIYVDGVSKATATVGSGITAYTLTATNPALGTNALDGAITGGLAHCAVYSVALSSTKVSTHYNTGIA